MGEVYAAMDDLLGREVAIKTLRGSSGLAARFITGYLYNPELDEAQGNNATPAFPHAWMEVYLPGAGWVEFDPTNGIIGTEGLIRVGVARDSEQAMPIRGTFTGAAGVGINNIVDVQVRTLQPMPEPEQEAEANPPQVEQSQPPKMASAA